MHRTAAEEVEQSFQLRDSSGAPDAAARGELIMKAQFLPAGRLTIEVLEGRDLRSVETIGRQDPYVVLRTSGQATTITRRTGVDTDGGTEPRWNETVQMMLVDQFTMQIECWDHDVIGSDDLIGQCQFSLLPVFKKGIVEAWVTIKAQSSYGDAKDAGQVKFRFEFTGPPGVAFPQHQPNVDTFDDSQRVQTLQAETAELQAVDREEAVRSSWAAHAADKEEEQAKAAERGEAEAKASMPVRSADFSDAEIKAAFEYMDLDHNGFVGAAEVRHLLVCMGELVTDEEIDAMISLVDTDGDGQVAYPEFWALVTDPDPSRPDFLKTGVASDERAGVGEPEDDMAKLRRSEHGTREDKRSMMRSFVRENGIGPAEVMYAFEKYTQLDDDRRRGGRIDFETFCDVLQVEATGEYHRMFCLFAEEDNPAAEDSADLKEIILGLCNFIPGIPREDRLQLTFKLFDVDGSGTLSAHELVEVLKGNHMQSGAAVARKAAMVLKQADASGDGVISYDEFAIVAAKFPNVLFPSSAEAPIVVGTG